MYDLYIKNYVTRAGEYVTDETLLYSIPTDPDNPNMLVDPKIKEEMGKAGTLEFSMNVGHPYYESLRQMKTIFRVEYDGDTIFRGRVLTIDTSHLTGLKKIHCEGDLAFLLDSQSEGVPDDSRTAGPVLPYLEQLIANHNAQMASDMADKCFVLGEVPGQYSENVEAAQMVHPDSNYKYGSSSWQNTQSAVTGLASDFGGYWRTRYQNGTVYLDWLDNYFEKGINAQTIELGENLLEISSTSEVNNIFTAVIPVGSAKSKPVYLNGYRTDIHGNNNYILVPQILQVFSDEELNTGFHSKQDYANAVDTYGMIFHTESFSNANTQAKLWEYATDWIKNNYCGGISSFSISAMDMHNIGEAESKLMAGDRVMVVYPDVDKRDTDPEAMIRKILTIMSVTYDLHRPQQNTYDIGIPNTILKRNYGEKNKSSSSKSASETAADDSEAEEKKRKSFDGLKQVTTTEIWTHLIDWSENSEEYQAFKDKYGDELAAAARRVSFLALTDEKGEKIAGLLNGKEGKITLNGPVAPEFKELGTNMAELSAAMTLDATKSGVTLYRPLPTMTVIDDQGKPKQVVPSWYNMEAKIADGMMQFVTDVKSGKIVIKGAPQQEDSPEDPLNRAKTYVAGLWDGAKGKISTTGIDLSNGLETVKDVVDGDMLSAVSLNGETSSISAGDPMNGLEKTLNLDGLTGGGTMTEMNFADGPDQVMKVLTGERSPSVGVDGVAAEIFGSNVTGDEDTETTKTFVFSGKDEGTGSVGKDTNGKWRVKLNDKVTYTDSKGVTKTASGFVTADDFDIKDTFTSLKTKLAVIDTALIDEAYINQLNATMATVSSLTGDTIIANTIIRAADIHGTNFYMDGANGKFSGTTGSFNTLTLANLKWSTGNDDTADIKRASISLTGAPSKVSATQYLLGSGITGSLTTYDFRHYHEINITEVTEGDNKGQMKVTIGGAVNGSTTTNQSFFKIADTQAYKNGVSAIDVRLTGSTIQETWNDASKSFTFSAGITAAKYETSDENAEKIGEDISGTIESALEIKMAASLDNLTVKWDDKTKKYTVSTAATVSRIIDNAETGQSTETKLFDTGSKSASFTPNDAFTSALNDVAVNVVREKWAGGQTTYKPETGKGTGKTVQLSIDSEWGTGDDINTVFVTIMDGVESTGYTKSISAAARYNAGRDSVTLSSSADLVVSQVAYNGQTVTGKVHLDLTNGTGKDISIDLSEIYKAGLNKDEYEVPVYECNLLSDGTVFDAVQFTVNAKDIYDKGVADSGPSVGYGVIDTAKWGNGRGITGYGYVGTWGSSERKIISIADGETVQLIDYQRPSDCAEDTLKIMYDNVVLNVVAKYVVGTVEYNKTPEGKFTAVKCTVDSTKHGTGGNVNIRKEPDSYSDLVTAVKTGASLYLWAYQSPGECTGTWLKVSTGRKGTAQNYTASGYTGYIMAKFIVGTVEYNKDPEGDSGDKNYPFTGIVDATGTYVPIWETSSTTTRVGTVEVGSTIFCKSNPNNWAGEWMQVKFVQGSTVMEGYMKSEYIKGTKAYQEAHPAAPDDVVVSSITFGGNYGIYHDNSNSKTNGYSGSLNLKIVCYVGNTTTNRTVTSTAQPEQALRNILSAGSITQKYTPLVKQVTHLLTDTSKTITHYVYTTVTYKQGSRTWTEQGYLTVSSSPGSGR